MRREKTIEDFLEILNTNKGAKPFHPCGFRNVEASHPPDTESQAWQMWANILEIDDDLEDLFEDVLHAERVVNELEILERLYRAQIRKTQPDYETTF